MRAAHLHGAHDGARTPVPSAAVSTRYWGAPNSTTRLRPDCLPR
jgi:hypothetical protein